MATKDFKVKNGLSVGESIRVDSGSIVVAGLEVINSSGGVVGVYQGFDSDFSISILNTTTDSLSEGLGNLYFTTARADSAFDVRLSTKTTDDLTEGLSLYYTQSRFDSDLSTKTTDDLVEGSNLYYTTSRVDSAFDVRLTIKTTDDLVEGSNLYYTDSRVLSYLTTNSYATTSNIDSAIAALVASAPSQLDTLNELAAAINDDSNFAGTITALIGEKVAKNDFSDYFDSNFSLKTTSNLIEGSNLYYTTARADSAFDVRLTTKTTDDLLEGSNLYYTVSRVDSDILDLVDSSYIETRRPAEVIFNVVNNGSSAYSFTGDGFPSSSDNPVLYLQKGLTYKFKVNSPSHPFEIRTSNGGSAYSDGVTNNSIGSGDLYFTVPMNAPSTLYYQCTIHSSMVGTIYITEAASITSDEITEGSNNLYYTSSRVDSDILSLVDSAYIQARQVDIYRDSSFVTGIIDSAYINARVVIPQAYGDSDVQLLIDSAYIQARQVDIYRDSSFVTGIIDSAYIQARQIIGGGSGTVDSAQTIALITDTIDSAYIQARTSNAVGLFTVADPFFNNVSLLLKFDDSNGSPSVTDYSTAQNTIIKEVNATISNEQSKFGDTSAKFIFSNDGAIRTGNIVAGGSLDFSTGRPDFTIECWVYPTALNTNSNEFNNIIIAMGPVGFGAGYAPLSIFISPSSQKFVATWNIDNTGGGNFARSSTAVAQLNSWSHVAFVRRGDSMFFFVNGILQGTDIFTGTPWLNTSNPWVIGQGTNDTYKFIGYIDDVRLTKGVARYTSNFNPPTQSHPVDYSEIRDVSTISISDFLDVDTVLYPPLNGQALIWDSASSIWKPGDVATSGIDSSAITDLIDSAYIQARQIIGGGSGTVDSAQTIALITDTVDSAYIAARGGIYYLDTFGVSEYKFTADSNQTIFTGIDDNGNILAFNSSNYQVYVNGIKITTSDYTANSLTDTITLVDPASSQDEILVTVYNREQGATNVTLVDSAWLTNLVSTVYAGSASVEAYFFTADSGQSLFTGIDDNGQTLSYSSGSIQVFVNGVAIVDGIDFTATNGSSITLDIPADSGDQILINDFGALYSANLGLDSFAVINIIDSAYIQSRQIVGGGGAGTVDSAQTIALITNTVDSAYIQARSSGGIQYITVDHYFENYKFISDSGQTIFSGSDFNGDILTFDSSEFQIYINGIRITDIDFTANPITNTVILTTETLQNDEVVITTLKVKPGSEVSLGLDSAQTIVLITDTIDSAYINARVDAGGSGTVDSAQTINLITNIVDSDYVQSRAILPINTGIATVGFYRFTATAGQTIFSGTDVNGNLLQYEIGSVLVYYNGSLIAEGADFTATTGGSITLTQSAVVGDDIFIVNYKQTFYGGGAAPGNLVENFYYTATAGQLSFSGTDDLGSTLNYKPGNIQVFLNGFILRETIDYTAINGTTITLTSATGLNDELTISKISQSGFNGSYWREVSNNYTAAAGQRLIVDTSTNSIQISLPSIAAMGDEIRIVDGTGNAANNNIIILHNGHKIQGGDSDLTVDVNEAAFGLVYYNTTRGWILTEK